MSEIEPGYIYPGTLYDSHAPVKLIVGCPVYERAWSLPRWFDSVESQNLRGIELEYLFAYSVSQDDTLKIITQRAPEARFIDVDDLDAFPDRKDSARLHVLAEIRNRMLERVRELDPDYYLSWDSDVLLAPDALDELFVAVDDFDAQCVSPLFGMLGGDPRYPSFPSAMEWLKPPMRSDQARHMDPDALLALDQPVPVDINMGVVLMSRQCYQAGEYRWHAQGEDLGRAQSLEEHGIDRWLAPQARGRHLWEREG
jgi:hypothetical protein